MVCGKGFSNACCLGEGFHVSVQDEYPTNEKCVPSLEEPMNRGFSSIIEASNVHDVHVTRYVSHLKNSWFGKKYGHDEDRICNI